tara:strand:- start:57 stop:695 length:639 start_codon:yes stop_codon:yes gene_type:complete
MTLPTSGLITVNDRGARAATTFGSVAAVGGNMVFIKKLTASSSGTLSFLNGSDNVVFDSTYKEYVFTFKNIHGGDTVDLTFQADTGTNTNYNTAITSTSFRAYVHEGDNNDIGFGYRAADDLAQGTGFQRLLHQLSDDNDHGGAGILRIFNPASTTFVKHFIFKGNHVGPTNFSRQWHFAGYFNTTTALTRVQFKMNSGNIDSGDICLYGIL